MGAAGDELRRFLEEIRWLFEARPALNMLCQNKSHAIEGGSVVQAGQTEATPLMAARGDKMSGANGCWGTLWSEERLVASLTATPRSGVRSGAEGIPVFWAPSSSFTDYSVVC